MSSQEILIVPNSFLSAVADLNQPVMVKEKTMKTVHRDTGTTSECTVSTNVGTIRGFSDKNGTDSNNQLAVPIIQEDTVESNNQLAVPATLDDTVESSDQKSVVASQNAAMNFNDLLPVVAVRDKIIISRNQLPAVPVQFQTTDFVSIVGRLDQTSTLPADPYSLSHFQLYVKDKACYNATPVTNAKIVQAQERVAYRVDLWTLMEHRSVEWKEKPYRGESATGQPLLDIFNLKDLPFETPATVIRGTQKVSHSLEYTQRKIACTSCTGKGSAPCGSCYGQGHVIPRCNQRTQCSKCHGQGTLNCTKCKGSGFLLTLAVLTVEWNTIHTEACYQNTFLPEKLILKRLKKSVFYDEDYEWNNSLFLTGYGTLYETIGARSPPDLAKKFGQDIQKQYHTHFARLKKQMIIRRMKCLIRQVEIIETDYQLEGYINKSEQHSGKYHSAITKV